MGYSFFSDRYHSQHHIWKESCFSWLSSWLYAVSGQVYHFCDLHHSIATSSLYDSAPDNKQACKQSTDDDRES